MIRYERRNAPDCIAEKLGETVWKSSGSCYQAIQTTLILANCEHCAFCDDRLGIGSLYTVEHFRPKSTFPSLVYAWHNLFPACNGCQSAKEIKFAEELLKPDDDGYAFKKYFQINYLSGEIEPLESASQANQLRADVTIRMYRLNKEAILRGRRQERKNWISRGSSDRDLNDFCFRYFIVDD